MKPFARLILAASFGLALAQSGVAMASNADACYVTAGSTTYKAECMGSYSVHTSEDPAGLSTSGNCYGACGPGCNFNCGSGGACTTHDYYTRTYGILSSQALNAFPPALGKWAGCETARYITTPATNAFSRVTSYIKGWANKLSGLSW
jgi:hypothetical protein